MIRARGIGLGLGVAVIGACNLALPIHETDDTKSAARDAGGDGVADQPGTDGASTAHLLFSSGFEDGVVLDDVPPSGPANNFSQHLHGKETAAASSEWPMKLWNVGVGDVQLYLGGSNVSVAELPNYLSAKIVTMKGPKGTDSRVFHQKRTSRGGVSYHYSTPKDAITLAAQGVLYVRYWMQLDAEWKTTLEQTTSYRILFELLQVDGTYLELRLEAGGDPVRWTLGRYDDPGAAPRWLERSEAKVPIGGQWFKVELMIDIGGQKAWAAIDGAPIATHSGEFSTGSPINDLYLFMHEGSAGEQWSDDLEIWDGFPSDAAPH